MFEKIKHFYDVGLYTKPMLVNFVKKSNGLFTADDYQKITGEVYPS